MSLKEITSATDVEEHLVLRVDRDVIKVNRIEQGDNALFQGRIWTVENLAPKPWGYTVKLVNAL